MHSSALWFKTLAPLKVGMWLPGNDLIILRRRHDSHIITTSWTSSLMKSLNDVALNPSMAPLSVTHTHALTYTHALAHARTHTAPQCHTEMIKLEINGNFALKRTSCHPRSIGSPHTFSPLWQCLLSLSLALFSLFPPLPLFELVSGCVSRVFWIFG